MLTEIRRVGASSKYVGLGSDTRDEDEDIVEQDFNARDPDGFVSCALLLIVCVGVLKLQSHAFY